MKKTNKLFSYIIPITTILTIILIWFFAYIMVGDEIVLPSPLSTIVNAFEKLISRGFWLALLGTLGRALIAFSLSFIIAMILVLVTIKFRLSNYVIKILISILRALPTIAVVLMLLLWTTSKVAAVIVTMIVILPTIYATLRSCFDNIDTNIIQMCDLYKVPKSKQFKRYIIPVLTPNIIEAIGGGISLNIKLMVAAEVIAGTAHSVGQLMNQSKIYFETSELFALVLIMVIISVVIELVCSYIANAYRRKNGLRKDK